MNERHDHCSYEAIYETNHSLLLLTLMNSNINRQVKIMGDLVLKEIVSGLIGKVKHFSGISSERPVT